MIDGVTENELKYIRMWKFFNRGFYISLIIWACGMTFSIIGGELFNMSPVIRIVLIFVSLAIYTFFLVGKSIAEVMLKKVI